METDNKMTLNNYSNIDGVLSEYEDGKITKDELITTIFLANAEARSGGFQSGYKCANNKKSKSVITDKLADNKNDIIKMVVTDHADPSVGIFQQNWELDSPWSKENKNEYEITEELEWFREKIREIYIEFAQGEISVLYDFEIWNGD